MSENKRRYFLQGDYVYNPDNPVAIAHYAQAGYTEVQVVPLDAIVIRRDELPEVEERDEPSGPYLCAAGVWAQDDGYETHMDRAVAQVAIAVYRQEHPPVDEGQVDALRDILLSTRKPADGRPVEEQYRDVARRLVERGVRVGDA